MIYRRWGTSRSNMIIRAGSPVIAILMVAALLLFCTTAAGADYTWTSTGCPSDVGVSCTAYDSANDILYAGTSSFPEEGEVYKYESGKWTATGLPTAGNVHCICYDDANNVLYAGSSDSIVYRYKSGSWTPTAGPSDGEVFALLCDGANGVVYASTCDYAGIGDSSVYRYSSGSWANISFPDLGPFVYVTCMAMDTAGNILYAGAVDRRVYKYDGATWTATGDQLGAVGGSIESLAYDQERGIIYAGLQLLSTGHVNVFRKDVRAGTGWVAIGALCASYDIYSLAVDESNNTLYASAYDGHVYKNCNASVGSTWIDMGEVSAAAQANILSYATGRNVLYAGNRDSDVYRARIPAVTSVEPATGAQGRTMDVVITGSNTDFTTSSKAVFSGDGVAVNSTTRLSATKVKANITINPLTYTGGRNVWVNTGGEKTNRLVNGFTVTEALSRWYLAEGTNAWGFNTYITIENPNNEQLHARLTYMDPNPASGDGVAATREVTLPPLSQTTLSSQPDIGEIDFSTEVECIEGKQIAVDRTMYWTGQGAPCPGGHNSVGVTAPAKAWYLPEGSSNHGFETWTLIQNPNNSEAAVTFTYMTEDAGQEVVQKKIPAYSRATYSMSADIGEHDSSIEVTSSVPVIAERSQYRDNRREGSCSIGATEPANDYFLAEGSTAWGFTSYVLVQNPNDTDTQVTLTYMTPDGPVAQPAFTMAHNSRKTIKVNDVPGVESTDLSTQVHADKPIIAERAMYWNGGEGSGEACHDSIGLSSPHMSFYLPDGQTSDGWETWTLIANPNPGAVRIEVTYLPQNGGTSVIFTDEIPPGSRRTYNMAGAGDRLPGIEGRASIVVRSLDGARPIMVERAMYRYNRGLGTDTVGAFED